MAKPNFPKREKTVLDDNVLKLYAEKLPEGTGRPAFSWYFQNNNPRIDVYTNMPNDPDNGKIRADIGINVAYEILCELEDLSEATTDEEYNARWENHGRTWNRAENRSNKELSPKSNIVVGRDKKGRIYIALLSVGGDRPKIRFYFGENIYRKLYINGQPASDAELSRRAVRGWLKSIEHLLPVIAAINWEEKVREDGGNNNNRGNGGGYNNSGSYRNNNGGGNSNGGSGGRYQQSSNSGDEDDIPFNDVAHNHVKKIAFDV